MTETKDVAKRGNPVNALAPQSFEQLLKFADMICQSDFVPTALRGKPGDVMAAIQFGNEIGLKPMQALQNVAVINGKPSIYGDAIPAVCMGHPSWDGYEESFDEGTMTARCEVRRKGQKPMVQTFSKADAVTAKLWGKQGPWTQYPKRMLAWRARGFAFRDAFPDATKGMIIREEALDYPEPKDITKESVRVDETKVEVIRTMLPDELEGHMADMDDAFQRGEGADWWKANSQPILANGTQEQRARFEARKDELKEFYLNGESAVDADSGGVPPSPPQVAPVEGEGVQGDSAAPGAPDPSPDVGGGQPEDAGQSSDPGSPPPIPPFPRLPDGMPAYEKDPAHENSALRGIMLEVRGAWDWLPKKPGAIEGLFADRMRFWRDAMTDSELALFSKLMVKMRDTLGEAQLPNEM